MRHYCKVLPKYFLSRKLFLYSKDALNSSKVTVKTFTLLQNNTLSINQRILDHQIIIRVISEGSCDTEDWSNDAEYSALIIGIN